MALEKQLSGTCRFAIVAMVLAACPGCYDGDALVSEARSAALNTRLAEVDFGTFRTTLPCDRSNNSFTDLELHIFGTVPRYHVLAVKKKLRTEEYRLRHETLAAVRTATRDELAEPSLVELRARIERVVNAIFDDAPVKSIGFYQVTLRQR
jgi:hypothetical protein